MCADEATEVSHPSAFRQWRYRDRQTTRGPAALLVTLNKELACRATPFPACRGSVTLRDWIVAGRCRRCLGHTRLRAQRQSPNYPARHGYWRSRLTTPRHHRLRPGSRAVAASGRCRSVPPSIGDGRNPKGISTRDDRVLPGADQHEDDHRGRTARGGRGSHGIAMAALPNSSSLGVAIRVSLMTESFRRRTSGEVVVSVGGRCRRPLHVVPADRPLGP